MQYVEKSIEDAIKRCKKNAKILVATQDLAANDTNIIFFYSKERK